MILKECVVDHKTAKRAAIVTQHCISMKPQLRMTQIIENQIIIPYTIETSKH